MHSISSFKSHQNSEHNIGLLEDIYLGEKKLIYLDFWYLLKLILKLIMKCDVFLIYYRHSDIAE